MRQLKVLSATLMALLTLGAVSLVSAAAASPLPELSVESGFKGESRSTKFETVAKKGVVCKSSTTEGKATTKKSGTFKIVEKECTDKELGTICTGLGDKSGEISISGEWNLVPGGASMLLLSPNQFHFTCALILVLIKGTTLGLVSPVDEKTTAYTDTVAEAEGHQDFNVYENDAGTPVETGLLASINGGAFEEAAEEATETKLTAERATELKGSAFAITDSLRPGERAPVGAEPRFTITNISMLRGIRLRELFLSNSAQFEWPARRRETEACERLAFEPRQSCTITTRYRAREAGSFARVITVDPTEHAALGEIKGA
jgi:hypothetical protein